MRNTPKIHLSCLPHGTQIHIFSGSLLYQPKTCIQLSSTVDQEQPQHLLMTLIDYKYCHFLPMPIKSETSRSSSNFLSSALLWWWHLRILCSVQTLKIYFTLTISASSSNPLAVVVKCWSKAKVEVVMLHSGPEGALQAAITAFLSTVPWHRPSAGFQSGCRCCRGSRVPVPDTNKETPLLAQTDTVYQLTLSTVDKLLSRVHLRKISSVATFYLFNVWSSNKG